MLDSFGFDLWADGYDEAVGLSDEKNSYPFAGYKRVLGCIYERIMQKPEASVLDLGFGTGTLTYKLYQNGCKVYGQDFSERMINIASAKMPGAKLYMGDIALGLAEPLKQLRFDHIAATYSLHHLTDEQKIILIKELLERLNAGGSILIGDVAFETRDELLKCKAEAGDEWDDEEIYFVFEELKKQFPQALFTRLSYCAGVIEIS